jgi:hypothetical protein
MIDLNEYQQEFGEIYYHAAVSTAHSVAGTVGDSCHHLSLISPFLATNACSSKSLVASTLIALIGKATWWHLTLPYSTKERQIQNEREAYIGISLLHILLYFVLARAC